MLGLFIGTTLYIVVVLSSLHNGLDPTGVPRVAVTMASVLTASCLFALLFYVHKIARSIIADNVVQRVARGLHAAIEALPPQDDDAVRAAAVATAGITLPPRRGSVSLGRPGYIQTIDYLALVELARRNDAVLRVAVRAGHFLLAGGAHVTVHAASAAVDLTTAIRSVFVIAEERSPAQDLEFSIRQLVEIGLRALSPGINDPFTAIAVIDRLGAALEAIFRHDLPAPVLFDQEQVVRVVADRSDADGLAEACFAQLRQAAGQHPSVLIRLADTIYKLLSVLEAAAARQALHRQLSLLAETTRQASLAPGDQLAVLSRVRQACEADHCSRSAD